jgi:hypothetical protein
VNVTLYNYMPTQYLASWLTNGVYFKSAEKLDDPYEGHVADATIEQLKDGVLQEVAKHAGEASKSSIDKFGDITRTLAQSSGPQTFMSFWHQNDKFSIAMSNEYAPGGIYLKTSSDSIIYAIRRELLALLQAPAHSPESTFHVVNYERSLDAPDNDKAQRNLLDLAFYRTKSGPNKDDLKDWTYQNEWRLIIDAFNIAALTGIEINGAIAAHSESSRHIDHTGLKIEKDMRGIATHLYLQANPKTLVHEIGVCTTRDLDEVATLCEKFGLKPPRLVTESEKMDSGPVEQQA